MIRLGCESFSLNRSPAKEWSVAETLGTGEVRSNNGSKVLFSSISDTRRFDFEYWQGIYFGLLC